MNLRWGLAVILLVTTALSAQPANRANTSVKHVVVVVEENHSYESVIGNSGMPYLNQLARTYSLATNYFANGHDSIPNYFWMTAGVPITYDDGTRKTFDVDNLVRHFLVSGLTWKSYAESIPSVGYTGYNTGEYVKRHNPFAYFTDVVNSSSERMNIVPVAQLQTDARTGRLPNLSFVVPNVAHDAHNGGLATADKWLQTYIKPILATPYFQPGGSGLLIVVFDESFTSDCRPSSNCTQSSSPFGGRVAAIFAGPGAKTNKKSSSSYDHQNLLSTICHVLGTSGCPGKGATAAVMSDMLQ